MSNHISNSLRSSSVIRVSEAGTLTVNLEDLSVNTSTESVLAASIKRVAWSTSGNISVARGANTVLDLYGGGEFRFSEIGHTLSEGSTDPITITITTGGTIFLEVTKDTNYTQDLVGY